MFIFGSELNSYQLAMGSLFDYSNTRLASHLHLHHDKTPQTFQPFPKVFRNRRNNQIS